MNSYKGRVLVLGGAGMLGRAVIQASRAVGYRTWSTGSSVDVASPEALKVVEQSIRPHFVVNCAGVIPLKGRSPVDTIRTNALGPWCVRMSFPDATTIINVSTDCVFSGQSKKPYQETDIPDAQDLYGTTKRMGEAEGLVNVRCSFIGHEHGLLAWLLSRPDGAHINGWVNAKWNGGTVVDVAEGLIQLFDRPPGIVHLSGVITSKYQLLFDLVTLFNLNVEVRSVDTPVINRALFPTVLLGRNLERLVRRESLSGYTRGAQRG